MKACDIMTTNVLTVSTDATVLAAIRIMLNAHISGLPVVDDSGGVVGIVTEGDFMRRAEIGSEKVRPRWIEALASSGRLAAEYVQSHARKVADIMTRDVVTASEDTSVLALVEIMERRRIKRVPIVRGRKLVGVVSRANLMHALASVATKAAPTTLSDAAIRDRLQAEAQDRPWARASLLNAVVSEGVVRLHGVIFDDRERDALRVAAENIPGVKRVEDHLVWLDPVSGVTLPSPEDARKASVA